MPKIYKICLFLSLAVLVGAFNHFAFAQGRGYFLEKGNELFIFDNINIRGYFLAEKEISGRTGLPGDVLIENQLILGANSAFNFCADEPANTMCQNKALIWTPIVLEVVKTAFNQINVNKLVATEEIIFDAQNQVNTGSAVRISGCFANDGSDDCNLNELKTGTLHLSGLDSLSGDVITFSGNNIAFGQIDLGPIGNLENQDLARKVAITTNCRSIERGGPGIYQDKTFRITAAQCPPDFATSCGKANRPSCYYSNGECIFNCGHKSSGSPCLLGGKVCAYLDVNF